MLDRKTLSRVLQKMESKGLCKIMKLSIPGLTNYGRNRESEAILLPEVEITTDFVKKLHERVRKFDAESRGQGVSRAKSSLNVPVLTGVVKRIIHPKKPVVPVIIPVKLKSLQENGFIPAKMVRVRMFHYYLWSYVTGKFNLRDHVAEGKDGVSSEADADLGGESSKSTIFALASAVHAMPLELYLQIIGSTRSVERVSERCKEGIRLRDIPPEELKAIIEHNSSGRLSWLVDVLCRLQVHASKVRPERWVLYEHSAHNHEISKLLLGWLSCWLVCRLERQLSVVISCVAGSAEDGSRAHSSQEAEVGSDIVSG